MRFSPDGTHLLGGVGNGQVYLDGLSIASHAGGWTWVTGQTVMGPGGYDSTQAGLYAYDLPSGPTRFTGDKHLATNFYGNGGGAWLLYLADGHTGSTDSSGNSWPSRVALGFIGKYQIFTDLSWVPVIFRDVSNGSEYTTPNPGEWTPLPDGSSWFSRNYRGVFRSTIFYACGYSATYGGLCVWQPFNAGSPTWLLSGDGHDFNPDIAARADGMLVVGSGINQGETGQRLFELHLSAQVFRVNGGAWQPLTPASPVHPPPQPLPPVIIAPFNAPIYVGPFFATGQYGNADHPGNCEILIRADYANMVRQRPCFADMDSAKTVPDGKLRGIYMSAVEGGAADANIQQAITYAAQRQVPVLVYSDTDDYPQWIVDKYLNAPNHIPVVRAYPKQKNIGEPLKATPAEDVARIRSTVAQLATIFPRVAIAHTYYTQWQNGPGTENYPLSHILAMQEGLAAIERDYKLFASLGFAALRPSGMKDYPELASAFKEECRAAYGEPMPILLTTPQPPQPQPIPPQPIPIPPQPQEPDDMQYTKDLLPNMLQGTFVPNGANWAIKKPNGKFVCVTPNGDIEERDVAASWESFRKNGAFLVAERDGNIYSFGFVE